jgi:hypothetical protein
LKRFETKDNDEPFATRLVALDAIFPLPCLRIRLGRVIDSARSQNSPRVPKGEALFVELIPEVPAWDNLAVFQAGMEKIRGLLASEARTIHIGIIPTIGKMSTMKACLTQLAKCFYQARLSRPLFKVSCFVGNEEDSCVWTTKWR